MKSQKQKPLNIKEENRAAIEVRLAEVNGGARAHTYGTYHHQVFDVADTAERNLEALGLAKKDRTGATYTSTSGGTVPSAYKYSRIATRIKIVRASSGIWKLVEVAQVAIYQKPPKPTLKLTQAQADTAVAQFKSQFSVATSC